MSVAGSWWPRGLRREPSVRSVPQCLARRRGSVTTTGGALLDRVPPESRHTRSSPATRSTSTPSP
jgi:hypothetical protein